MLAVTVADGVFAATDFSGGGAFSREDGLLVSCGGRCSDELSDLRFSLLFFECLAFFEDDLKNFGLDVELLRFLTYIGTGVPDISAVSMLAYAFKESPRSEVLALACDRPQSQAHPEKYTQ